MEQKLRQDYVEGATVYEYEVLGLAREEGKKEVKLGCWFTAGTIRQVIACDFPSKNECWCLVARRKRMELDIDSAWCLLELVRGKDYKAIQWSKTSSSFPRVGRPRGAELFEFAPGCSRWLPDLRALGAWRQGYEVSRRVQRDSAATVTGFFSACPPGEEWAKATQENRTGEIPVWLAERRVGDAGPGFPVRRYWHNVQRRDLQMSALAMAAEMHGRIQLPVDDANRLPPLDASSSGDQPGAGAEAFSTAGLYRCEFLGAVAFGDEHVPAEGAHTRGDPDPRCSKDPVCWAAWAAEDEGRWVSRIPLLWASPGKHVLDPRMCSTRCGDTMITCASGTS